MRSPTPRWLLPAVLVAVVVAVGAALVARQLYAAPDPQAPAAVLPTETSIPLSAQPGSSEVRGTSDATVHPLYQTVHDLLQTYFDAINSHRYDLWSTTVTGSRLAAQPQAQWSTDYRSTKDGSILIYRIESGPADSARVMLTFTSTQDPADAPIELPAPCIRWNVIFPLARQDSGWKLDSGPTSASPQHERC